MDRSTFQGWLDRYVEAWRSNDAAQIGDLFTEDATYAYHPSDDPLKGREAIVATWLESPDDPGSWEARYEAWAVDGDRGVGYGISKYFATDDAPETDYYNVYLIEFADDGRARSFLELFAETRDGQRARIEKRIAEAVEAARKEWQDGAATADRARELAESRVQG